MKKILFYINLIDCGGAERVITNLANHFAEDGYDVTLMTTYKRENEFYLSEKVNREIIYCEESSESRIVKNLFQLKYIRTFCEQQKVDIVISFMYEPSVRAILATRGLKTKVIVSVRDNPRVALKNPRKAFAVKSIFSWADGCVFQTKEAKDYFGKKLKNKSVVIYNMVEDEFYQNTTGDSPQYIVACGRLSKIKNYSLLIKAYEKICMNNKPRLIIYGDGEERGNLKKLIRQLKLENQVILAGYVKDVRSVLKNAKLFVMSSNSEGMPNALMEAMAMGIPCVATDCPCGGPRELFGEELKELLVPVDNVTLLANKMQEILLKRDINSLKMKIVKRAQLFNSTMVMSQWKGYIAQI